MVKPFRIALVFVGLAVAVYGLASLTGQPFGAPPWWTMDPAKKSAQVTVFTAPGERRVYADGVRVPGDPLDTQRLFPHDEPRPGRAWISAGVAAAGLALAAFAAWPRRAKPTPPG